MVVNFVKINKLELIPNLIKPKVFGFIDRNYFSMSSIEQVLLLLALFSTQCSVK